jgi:hypothetical protein
LAVFNSTKAERGFGRGNLERFGKNIELSLCEFIKSSDRWELNGFSLFFIPHYTKSFSVFLSLGRCGSFRYINTPKILLKNLKLDRFYFLFLSRLNDM